MIKTYIHSGFVFNTENETFEKKNLLLENGMISKICDDCGSHSDSDEIIDASGKFITPAYIDIHTHGALKLCFQKQTKEEYRSIFKHYTNTGTASVFPTLSTDTYESLLKLQEFFVNFQKKMTQSI